MDRVMIIGCGCSGKSTLARMLGEKTGLPVIHLDTIWWSPGNWQHLEREEFDIRLEAELEKPRWIMDGNYNRTIPLRLEKCDTVLYLDFSTWMCLWGWIKRVITSWGSARPDMAPGCREWFDPEFGAWILKYNRTHRKNYHAMLAEQEGKNIYIFKNRRQIKAFCESL